MSVCLYVYRSMYMCIFMGVYEYVDLPFCMALITSPLPALYFGELGHGIHEVGAVHGALLGPGAKQVVLDDLLVHHADSSAARRGNEVPVML